LYARMNNKRKMKKKTYKFLTYFCYLFSTFLVGFLPWKYNI
jgi:hypothetical protein